MIKVNKLLSILFLISVILLFGCNKETSSEQLKDSNQKTTNFQTYSDSKNTFSIDYPPDWEVIDDVEIGGGIKFVVPNASDMFPDSLIIVWSDLTVDPMTLEEINELNMQMQSILYPNVISTDSNRITFLNYDAYELIHVSEYTKSKTISIIVNNNAFILTFSASVKTYDQYQNLVDQMLNSFEVN